MCDCYSRDEMNEWMAEFQAQIDLAVAEIREELNLYVKKPYLWAGESTITSHVADGHVVDPDV